MENTMERHRWLSVDDIAKHLGIKKETVYAWVAKKGMPSHKVGRLRKFRIDEVDEWITTGEADSRNQNANQ